MITSQEIHDTQFSVARKGYSPDEVDALLVKLEEDLKGYETLSNDHQALKRSYNELLTKARAVALKNEEYRGSEFAIGQAMKEAQQIRQKSEIDAQARAEAIISEAKAKAANIVEDAQAEAKVTLEKIDRRIAEEEAHLQEAKLSSAKFFDVVRNLCLSQIEKLSSISGAVKPEEAEVAPEVSEIFETPAESDADDAMRIQEADAYGIYADAAALDSDNTQIFSFSMDS